jgi:hypothetical protein
MPLPRKELKYNLQYKKKRWLETLSTRRETAIISINIKELRYYRHTVTKTIKKIDQMDNNILKSKLE